MTSGVDIQGIVPATPGSAPSPAAGPITRSGGTGTGGSAGSGAGGCGMWPLTEESRDKIVARIAANLAALSFFAPDSAPADHAAAARSVSAARLGDEAAREHALVIEREAFAAASDRFRTKGGGGGGGASSVDGVAGAQPALESAAVLAYAQHASDAMIALLKAKMGPASRGLAADHAAAPLEAEARKGEPAELDLSLGGEREFVGLARAEELLAPLLQLGAAGDAKPRPYHRVRLSTKSFKLEACPVLVRALKSVAGELRHADASDIIAGQPEDDALAVLSEVSGALADATLVSLDLSNNALGEKGLRACAPLLTTQRGLEALYLCNNGISAQAGEALVELLPQECVQSLSTLHFFNNMTGDEGAVALAELVGAAAESRLRDLRFSSTRVQADGGVALANAIARGSRLVRLDLRDNLFGEEGAAALAQALPKHPDLEELVLGDTALTSDGACEVVEALSRACKKLRVLDLGGNEITLEGAERLAQALEGLPLLQQLILSENELGDEGAAVVAAAAVKYTKELEQLDFCTNEIGDKGAKAAARAACELPQLQALKLNGNAISKSAIAQINKILIAGCSRGLDVLGPLDENDDGENEDDD